MSSGVVGMDSETDPARPASPKMRLPSISSCLAAIYALIACGYVLIYRVSRVLNLAHGELLMLSAYLLLTTASLFAGHPVAAIAAARGPEHGCWSHGLCCSCCAR